MNQELKPGCSRGVCGGGGLRGCNGRDVFTVRMMKEIGFKKAAIGYISQKKSEGQGIHTAFQIVGMPQFILAFKYLWGHPCCTSFVVGHVGLNVTCCSKVTYLEHSASRH